MEPDSSTSREAWLAGVPLAPGIAYGRACFFREPCASEAARPETSEDERLHKALSWMAKRLEGLAIDAGVRLGEDAAEVFQAYRMILEDPDLQQSLFSLVQHQSLAATQAVAQAFKAYEKTLQKSEVEYLRERAGDLGEIKRGLLSYLGNTTPSLHCRESGCCQIGQCRLQNDHILVAPELTPALTLEIDHHTVGFLLEKGGHSSHAAILARALSIPTVSGVRDATQAIPLEAECLIDGTNGEVIINPSEQTLRSRRRFFRCGPQPLPVTEPVVGLTVMANIDRPQNVREALIAKAEGIGLTRTEMIAQASGRLLTEWEQASQYNDITEAMRGKPVYIRLWDLGCDKLLPGLEHIADIELVRCTRGARLLLGRPDLLRPQARALARASQRQPIHVVYPMVADIDQFRELRALFDAHTADVPVGTLRHGVMFEVPSACMQVRELLDESDFGCIGTNDLIQYLFAIDRIDEHVNYEKLFESSLLWNLIGDLASAAKERSKPLSICGELAGNPRFTTRIMEVGISILSTNPRRIADVRRAACPPPNTP